MRNNKHIVINKLARMGLLVLCCLLVHDNYAQTKRVQFSGVGRSLNFYDQLSGDPVDADTINPDKSFNGYALMDVGFNIKPNKFTKVEAELRLRNEFGAFWGAGVSVAVRKLLVQGLIKEKIKYSIGDVNFNLTPYTLQYNPGVLNFNQAKIFSDFTAINQYENLVEDSAWRQQGMVIDFGLTADKFMERTDFKFFVARNRPYNLFANPERYTGGFDWKLKQSKYLELGATLVDVFEVPLTSKNSELLNNMVLSWNGKAQYDLEPVAIGIKTENGLSRLSSKNDDEQLIDVSDFFIDARLFADLDIGLAAELGYINIGPNFFSPGAQATGQFYFTGSSIFPELGNNADVRFPTIADLQYDHALTNFEFGFDLNRYSYWYANALPYGTATPNRTGIIANVDYTEPKKQFITAGVNANILSEVVGSGSTELKSFVLVKGYSNFYIGRLIDVERDLNVSLAVKTEQTTRDGAEGTTVDLQSNYIETGFEAEFLPDFSLLLGYKLLQAEGNEFIAIRNQYNQVNDFTPVAVDVTENLLATGLKYSFEEDAYLTAQYITSDIEFNNPGFDPYGFNFSRFMLLFNMKF